uniref:VWFA domain-containing protein n=1 Tax=Ascaris lumbricoides TaxID=6252 RepID=A0A9J2PTH3_ASCLU
KIVESTFETYNVEELERCFDRFDHSSLIGFADRVESGIEASECLAKCAQCSACLDDEPCNAIVYYRHQKECIMMVATRRENEQYFLRDDFECDYYEKRKNCNESGKCVDELSLIFVMDGSDSIGNDGFNNAKTHIGAIVTAARNIVEELMVTVVQSGIVPALEIDSMIFDKMISFKAELNAIEWRGGPSMLGATLEAVIGFAHSKNAWMVVLTDGISTDSLHAFIKKRAEAKINILVVGLTDAPNRKVLLDISGRENFIFINETNESLITFFKQQLCTEKTIQRQTRSANIERRVGSNDDLWLRTSENGNEPNDWDETVTIRNELQNSTTTLCSAIAGSRLVMTDCSRALRFVCHMAVSV